MRVIRPLLAALAGISTLIAAVLVAPAPPGALASRLHSGVQLALVAYSTPREAYGLIVPAFEKTKAGKGVSFTQSFGASGDQSRSVAQGLPADVVAFSLEPDISRLVQAHLVKSTWYRNPYHGFVTDSVVVFAVRPGNPKHIHTWNDLIKKGVDVITPNPFTSGGAQWNVMAAYGAQIAQHKTRAQAIAYLTALFDHVSVQDKSARDELQTFVGGKGDVMLAYENEAITAQESGQKLSYIVPPQSILIENPVAVTTSSKHQKEANAFVSFLYSRQAQILFGQKGYRPVRKDVQGMYNFKRPAKLFTIRNLGSWPRVEKDFFDPNSGVMAKIEAHKGVSP